MVEMTPGTSSVMVSAVAESENALAPAFQEPTSRQVTPAG